MRDVTVGRWAAASAAILFGTAFVAVSFQLRAFEPVTAAMWRGGAGSALLVVPLLVARDGSRGTPNSATAESTYWTRLARIAVLGLLGGPIFILGEILAVSEIGASVSGFLVGLYAVLAAVIAPFILSERLTVNAMAGLLLALVGTVLLSQVTNETISIPGVAAGLIAASAYSFFLVLGRRWSAPYGIAARTIALAAAILTAAVLAGWLIATDPGALLPTEYRLDSLMAVAWLGLVMVVGQTLVMASVRRIPSQHSAAFLLLNPITAAVTATLILDERMNGVQVIGAILVLAGMAFASGAFGRGSESGDSPDEAPQAQAS